MLGEIIFYYQLPGKDEAEEKRLPLPAHSVAVFKTGLVAVASVSQPGHTSHLNDSHFAPLLCFCSREMEGNILRDNMKIPYNLRTLICHISSSVYPKSEAKV